MGWIWDDRLAEVWAPPGRAGSGVVIGTCGVLTARHVIDAVATGAQTGPVLARVIRRGSPPPAWVPMRIAGEDAAWDLAVLHVDQEAPEAAGWVRPVSGSPVVVTVGGSSEHGCESVGFPDEEVQRPDLADPAGWVRQSEQLLGMLLPMGQAKPAVLLSGTLPREWMPLDAETATPDVGSGWRGMSGAGVVLSDGRLAGVAVAAEDRHQQRRLYVVPLASVLAQSEGLARALADAAGAPVVAETRFAPVYRRLLYPATLRTDGSPVRFDEVADLGVLGVKPIDLRGDPSYLTYVPRDDDPMLTQQLHKAAAAKRMLLVAGYSGSGKSRSAARAVRQAYPAHRLLRPLQDQLAALVDLPLADLARAVVWLDDVEKYQHPALAETLRKLLGAGLVLVGTIRLAQYRALTEVDDSHAEFRNPVGEALSDQRLVQQVDWKRDWSQSERDRTADYVTNWLARAAVRKGLSLSVWAVAGPELVEELKDIQADNDRPCRYALVRAVLDWHHTGLTSPIPWPVAVDLVKQAYLDHPASDDDLTDAVNWATRPIGIDGRRGRYSLLTRQQDALTANDYIEDWDGRHQPSRIPDATWRSAIANAPSMDSLWNIGFTAHFAGRTAVEQTAMQTLANAGHTGAMVNLGLLLRDRDPAAAQAWWERAAAAGNADAMFSLGLLLRDRDPAAAQAWWERAAAAGKTDAMVGLGLLLRDRDPAAAQAWWERAAAAGNTEARVGLEVLLADRDSAAAQATWSALGARWSAMWASWGRMTTTWTQFYSTLALSPFEMTQELAELTASAYWEAEAKVWGPDRELISEVARSFWLTAGKPPGMDISFWVAAQKYVASLIALGTPSRTSPGTLIDVFSPEAYFRRVQDLAQAMSRRSSQQVMTSQLTFWLSAENHILTMLAGAATAAQTLQDAIHYLTKISDLSIEEHLRLIEENAYYIREGAGRPFGAGLERPGDEPPNSGGGGDAVAPPPEDGTDAQHVNFWIRERERTPSKPLIIGTAYTGVFLVGDHLVGNLASGERNIPTADIPPKGLDTTWIVSSGTVALIQREEGGVDEVTSETFDDGEHWTARFRLRIPPVGNSKERLLIVVPRQAAARLDVTIYVRGDVYRKLWIDLESHASAAPLSATSRPPQSGSPRSIAGHDSVGIQSVLCVPAAEVGIRTPPGHESLTLGLHTGFVYRYLQAQGLEDQVPWVLNPAAEQRISEVRGALDTFRQYHTSCFDSINCGDLDHVLEKLHVSQGWSSPTEPDSRAAAAWNSMACDSWLRRLAFSGNQLFDAFFPPGSDIRRTVLRLRPGDRIHVAWFLEDSGKWIAHVPWALMYVNSIPESGQPIDAEQFLGLRFRLSYSSRALAERTRALGLRDQSTRAQLLYWGGDANDPVAEEALRHRKELASFITLVLPRTQQRKDEICRFLAQPKPTPVTLIYLYCQGGSRGGAAPVLRFGSTNAVENVVELMDIGTLALQDQPLVFVNACESAASDPFIVNELEESFLSRGSRAFIGTETRVPVQFAARFARVFFFFLYRGETSGEALALSRRFFWNQYCSIGGLFYSYANDYELIIPK
jgi:TPR repeat protein